MTKAVIMAGGEGTRLRPLTCNRPKPMIPIINRPVMEHTVNLLRKYGISDIVVSLFYLPENVQNYFGDGSEWNVNLTYSVEETPLGTAGGVKKAMGYTKETFLVLSGDGIIDFDIGKIIEFHRQKKSPFTIVLKRVKKPTEYGIVILDREGRIEKFLEKPAWGEVFSDTVNTGMYVIEPEIIRNYVPAGQKFDFSMDLFPQLQMNDIPLYGYISDDYWCDIGNLDAYREAHHDIMDGLVKIDFPGKKIGDNIWGGKNCDIAPDAVLRGTIILGNFVRVKKGAEISEFTVIGDNCVIQENASVRRSTILNSTFIGPGCEIRGAIVGKRCVLEEGVSIYEGAVVSDDCQIGKGAEIPSGIRVWPEKIIEQGTRLTNDLVWGQTEKKVLFGSEGIVGAFNVKITPEFAAKLGSALGAYLGKGTKAVVSRDITSASRLIKRAVTSGLLSMGVDVYDMEIESIPLNRYSTRFLNADLGVYIQVSPLTRLQIIQIRIFNKYGFPLPPGEEKKIENIFFRGDYPRKDALEVGKLYYPVHHIESYIANARNYLDTEVLHRRKWNVIVDCFYGSASYSFPALLSSFGCVTTVLRGQIKEFVSEDELREETRKAIENIVNMARANREIAVMIGPHGQYLTVIDEKGTILSDDDISALLSMYYLKYREETIINIPVTSSMIIDEIVATHGGQVVRVNSDMRAPRNIEDIFLESNTGRFPHLARTYDPMITFLIILELAAREGTPLSDLKERLPRSNLTWTSIPCSMDDKAALMRVLSADAGSDKIQMIDGVRIVRGDAWILVLPDASQPLIHLYAEAKENKARDALIEEYTHRIKTHKGVAK